VGAHIAAWCKVQINYDEARAVPLNNGKGAANLLKTYESLVASFGSQPIEENVTFLTKVIQLLHLVVVQSQVKTSTDAEVRTKAEALYAGFSLAVPKEDGNIRLACKLVCFFFYKDWRESCTNAKLKRVRNIPAEAGKI
jgi:hypothetical protein